jgi:hypothetical protein
MRRGGGGQEATLQPAGADERYEREDGELPELKVIMA